MDRLARGVRLPAAVPDGHRVGGQELDQPVHVSVGARCEETPRELVALLGRRLEPGRLGLDPPPRAREQLPAVRLALSDDLRDLRVPVLEDLAKEEHRPLHRLQALEEHEERHRQRVGHLRLLGHVLLRSGHEGLGEPGADIGFPPRLHPAEAVDREARHRGRQIALRRVDLRALLGGAAPPEERVLHHVLGLRDAPEHPVGDREQQWPQLDEGLVRSDRAGSVPRHVAHETRQGLIP